jgi:hypothetical protein
LKPTGLVALAVGTCLLVVIHGPASLVRDFAADLIWQAPATYGVLLVTAIWGILSNARGRS